MRNPVTISIFAQDAVSSPQRATIFTPNVVINTPPNRIFNQKAFIPELLGADLGKEERKILSTLRFGNDNSAKFLTLDRDVMETFHAEHTQLLELLYHKEFSHSKTLMNRLLAIVEEDTTKPSFFPLWGKRTPKERTDEIRTILTTLEAYEKNIAASRIELEHRLEVFEELKQRLHHYQNVASYLLEEGNYTILAYPDEIRSILIHKIATLHETIESIDRGHDVQMLKRYLLHFSLVVEELRVRYAPFLVTLAQHPLKGERKNTMIQTLKGFLDD